MIVKHSRDAYGQVRIRYGSHALGSYGLNLNPLKIISKVASTVADSAGDVARTVVDSAGDVLRTVADSVGDVAGAALKVLSKLPLAKEYSPDKLIVTAFNHPLKFSELSAAAWIAAPGLGAAYMAQFIPPAPTAWPLVIETALAKGGPKYFISDVLKPIVSNNAKLALAFAKNGPEGFVLQLVRSEIEDLPDSLGTIKAFALAIASSTSTLNTVRGGVDSLSKASSFSMIGDSLLDVASSFGAGDVKKQIQIFGRTFQLFADDIAKIVGTIGGVFNGYNNYGISPELDQAINGILSKVLGLNYSRVAGLSADQLLDQVQPDPLYLEAADFLSDAVSKFSDAMRRLVVFKGLADTLDGVASQLSSVVSTANDILQKRETKIITQQREQAAAAKEQALLNTNRSAVAARLGVQSQGVSSAKEVDPNTLKVIPPKASLVGVAATGAGVGFLLGGPPGAILGGGAGAVIGALKRLKGQ